MLLHSCICRHAGRCIGELRSQTTMCSLATALYTHLLAPYSSFSSSLLILTLRGGFKDAARPLQLHNTAATPLRRHSEPSKQAIGKGAPAESGSTQSFSVNLSTPVKSQPDRPSPAARPPLLRLSLTWSAYGGFRCTRKLRNYNIQNATPHCSPRLSM